MFLCAKCLVWRELSTLTYLSPSRLVRDLRCACVVTCGGKARLRKLQKAESVTSNPFPFLPFVTSCVNDFRDVAAFRKDDGSTLDHTHFVARRLAFATVPLNCVMVRL